MSEGRSPLAQELDELRERGRLRSVPSLERPAPGRVKRAGRELIDLSSNDYLGLSRHPALSEAACEAALRRGTGSGGSRLMSGGLVLHEELEAALAE